MTVETQLKKLKERMKKCGLCVQPDRHNPHLICGYPLPCPHHTIVMDEEQAIDFLEELADHEES